MGEVVVVTGGSGVLKYGKLVSHVGFFLLIWSLIFGESEISAHYKLLIRGRTESSDLPDMLRGSFQRFVIMFSTLS